MTETFSRMLGAALCAAIAGLHLWSAQALAAGGAQSPAYHGRYAGTAFVGIRPPVHPGVHVFRGGRGNDAHRDHGGSYAGVMVYYGGGNGHARRTDAVDALDVVTIVRGAGPRRQYVDAVCAGSGGERMPAARTGLIHGAGELFRCEDGLTLLGFVSRTQDGAGGREIVCERNMSLWRGHGGAVSCAPKRRLSCGAAWLKMPCGEAELRHAYGAGEIVSLGERPHDHEAVIVTRGMVLTGGVGDVPY